SLSPIALAASAIAGATQGAHRPFALRLVIGRSGMTGGNGDALALIGDVGGTNCRLAVTPLAADGTPEISNVRTYPAANFPTFEDAVATYLREARVSVS